MDHFLRFHHPDNLKNQNFEKLKKKHARRHYHFTHVHHKWRSWCMVPDIRSTTDRFLSFWMIFCPFSPLTTQKIKILEKWKIHGDFANLHMCTIHENHMIHDSWDMEHDRQNFLSSWVIFALLIPLAICKINILKKMKKKPWGYYHFTHVYHKLE